MDGWFSVKELIDELSAMPADDFANLFRKVRGANDAEAFGNAILDSELLTAEEVKNFSKAFEAAGVSQFPVDSRGCIQIAITVLMAEATVRDTKK